MADWPLVIRGRLEGGEVRVSRSAMAEALRGRGDQEIEVHVYALKAARSKRQNALYWGVYVPALVEYTGFDGAEVHEILKARFLSRSVEIIAPDGAVIEACIAPSTTRLTTVQFGEFLERVRAFAAELGVYIPDPGEEA